MAAAAEALQPARPNIDSQEYAHSVSAFWELGRIAVDTTVTPEYIESTTELARADFTTAVTEMLKTDPEFRELLDIDNSREHAVIDGTVRSKNGRPMVDIIRDGARASANAAKVRPELMDLAIRDAQDEAAAMRADRLKPGQSLIGLSLDPKEALKRDKDTYTQLGFVEGLAYLQGYSRQNEETLAACSYSVDLSDAKIWREIFAELGVDVPQDESDNTWLRHAFEITATAGETKELLAAIREKYYQKAGGAYERSSVTEYVETRGHIINQIFDYYYPALGEAVYTGKNNKTLKNFAAAMLQKDVRDLDPDVRQKLVRVANADKFNDNESYKLIDSMLRYAAVEELRKDLASAKVAVRSATGPQQPLVKFVQPAVYPAMPVQMNQLLAQNIESGVQAQRSYGGCPGQIKLSRSDKLETWNDLDSMRSPQEAYGGQDTQAETSENQNSNHGKIRCIQCREYVAKAEVVKKDCWECPRCKHKVDICSGEILNQGQTASQDKKTNVFSLFVQKSIQGKEIRKPAKMEKAS